MSTQLPEHMIRVSIQDMLIGEEAYTVPWAIQVDQNGQCWIRGDYSFSRRPFGTNQMRIRRTASGFEVEIPAGEKFDTNYISPQTKSRMGLLSVVRIS